MAKQIFEMMLVEHEELLLDVDYRILKEYRPEDMSIGYDIIQFEANSIEEIVVRKDDGNIYKACKSEDGYVSVWEKLL